MKSLVIVESPTKAKTIGRFLGDGYDIKYSMGHVMDLPKSILGVDVEHNFEPQLEMIEDKMKIINDLKKSAKSADTIVLATDPDREGEAIASHIKDVLGSSSKFKVQSSKFRRIVFHEITKEAIEEALQNPRDVDHNLVNAQTARRVLDRLVGYQLSPLLWQKVRRGLSAGRVQSIALRIIVEREREIEKFKKEDYWTIHAMLKKIESNGPVISIRQLAERDPQHDGKVDGISHSVRNDKNNAIEFTLIEINGEKIETQEAFVLYDGDYKVTKTTLDTEEKAVKIIKDIEGKQFVVKDVLEKENKRSPYAPYTTSTLQQDASRRFGLSGKRTMSLAQKLYEEGFITYHRTDSVTLSQSAINQIRKFIGSEFGDKYLPGSQRFYTAKQKLAQEAHEGIRPTKIGMLTVGQAVDVQKTLGKECFRVYEMIWRRALASQMADAIIESTIIIVDSQTNNKQQLTNNKKENIYTLKANGSILVFDGFLKVNPQALQDTRLPKYAVGDKLDPESVRDEKHETPPPPRYNDASLIQALEEKGIGRPSTYASIISTIVDRAYVERSERRFEPTNVGVAVNDFLVKNFSDIDDIPFTAQMEDDLDEVAHGNKEWVNMMKEFYKPFAKKLDTVKDAKRVKIATEETQEKCPECGKANLVIRIGRFGKFLSCARFPDCKFTKPFVEETNLTCPKDGGTVIVKKTRKGRKFFGCSNYPNCDFAAWKLEDIKK